MIINRANTLEKAFSGACIYCGMYVETSIHGVPEALELEQMSEELVVGLVALPILSRREI